MLLQSQRGRDPPAAGAAVGLGSGSVRGLRARGGYTVDVRWKDGRLVSATIRADRDGTARIRYREATAEQVVKAGRAVTVTARPGGLVIRVATVSGVECRRGMADAPRAERRRRLGHRLTNSIPRMRSASSVNPAIAPSGVRRKRSVLSATVNVSPAPAWSVSAWRITPRRSVSGHRRRRHGTRFSSSSL